MISFGGSNEALEKFQKTVDLLARNKVNKHNAFENRLTDEIDQIVQMGKGFNDGDRWVRFSTAVDACGRVYGYCVDNLHDETLMVWGGVNRTVENEQGAQRPPIYQKRNYCHGLGTLETNEGVTNLKDWDRLLLSEPIFNVLGRSFDCSEFTSLLLSNVSVNGNVDLVLDSRDLVVSGETAPVAAEVNLEGIIEYSICHLLETRISEKIEGFEENRTEDKFLQAWEKINERVERVDVCESASEQDVEMEQVLFKPSVAIEDRVLGEFALDFIQNSDKVIFSKDFLVTGVTKKPKKRKRKELIKDEFVSQPFCILKVEELNEGENALNADERKKNSEDKTNKVVERGYKESRLGNLFSRNGRFVGISFVEKNSGLEDTGPLSVDPLTEVFTANEVRVEGKVDLNIRVLKDSMKKVVENSANGDFGCIVSKVQEELREKEIEKVSVHACFVTLLHLANENSLELEASSQNSFYINRNL